MYSFFSDSVLHAKPFVDMLPATESFYRVCIDRASCVNVLEVVGDDFRGIAVSSVQVCASPKILLEPV